MTNFDLVPVTGPVARFARQIAGQGYIVAAPSSYHDFTGPEPLAYDVPGTDSGNAWKVEKVRFLCRSSHSPDPPFTFHRHISPSLPGPVAGRHIFI